MRAMLSIFTLSLVLAALLPHTDAHAQRSGATPPWELSAPTLMPWEKRLKQYYERQNRALPKTYNPNARTDAISKRLYADPGRSLGLPSNRYPGDGSPGDTATVPTFDPYAGGYDRNGDGAISRSEYLRGNHSVAPPGPTGASRASRMNQRLDSQFRSLDADHDGRVTAEEYNAVPGARF